MNTIIERITEAIMDILIGLIKSCLDNMFTSVNEQVGTIAGQVGQTPQGWNAGIFNLIQTGRIHRLHDRRGNPEVRL